MFDDAGIFLELLSLPKVLCNTNSLLTKVASLTAEQELSIYKQQTIKSTNALIGQRIATF